jgi:hypothetical protein
VNPWCGTRRSAAHDVSNVTDERVLAHVPSDLNGYFIRLDLTVDKRLDLAWTYEMLYLQFAETQDLPCQVTYG